MPSQRPCNRTTTADRVSVTVYAERDLWRRVKHATAERDLAASALLNAYLERFDLLAGDDPERAEMLDWAQRIHRARSAR